LGYGFKELGLDPLNGLVLSFHHSTLDGSAAKLASYRIGIRESAWSSIYYEEADALLPPVTSLLCAV
jgi:hypothetical protein